MLCVLFIFPTQNPCKGNGSAQPLRLQPFHHPTRSVSTYSQRPAHPVDPGTCCPPRINHCDPPFRQQMPRPRASCKRLLARLSSPSAYGQHGSARIPFPDESFSLEINSSKGMICSYSLLMNF